MRGSASLFHNCMRVVASDLLSAVVFLLMYVFLSFLIVSANCAGFGMSKSISNSLQRISRIVSSKIDAAPSICPLPEPSIFLSSVENSPGFAGISFRLHPFFSR